MITPVMPSAIWSVIARLVDVCCAPQCDPLRDARQLIGSQRLTDETLGTEHSVACPELQDCATAREPDAEADDK